VWSQDSVFIIPVMQWPIISDHVGLLEFWHSVYETLDIATIHSDANVCQSERNVWHDGVSSLHAAAIRSSRHCLSFVSYGTFCHLCNRFYSKKYPSLPLNIKATSHRSDFEETDSTGRELQDEPDFPRRSTSQAIYHRWEFEQLTTFLAESFVWQLHQCVNIL
jgi:hypothetical protein